MKLFFGYSKYYCVTSMLLELGLPSFDTLIFFRRVSIIPSLSWYSEWFYCVYMPALLCLMFCVLFIVCVSVRMCLFVCCVFTFLWAYAWNRYM